MLGGILSTGATGTINGNLDNQLGVIEPGGVGSTGRLIINGTFTQSSTGTLNIEVNDTGSTAGTDFDQVLINSAAAGAANLDGDLNVILLGAAPPADIRIIDVQGGGTLINPFILETIDPAFDSPPTYGVSFVDLVLAGPVAVTFDNLLGALNDLGDGLNWNTGIVPISGLDDILLDFSGQTLFLSGGIVSINTLDLTVGTTLNLSGGTLDIASNSTLNGDVNLSAGTLTGAGNIILNGAFNWTGGSIAGAGLLTTAGVTTITSAGTLTTTRDWNNTGTVNWDTGSFTLMGSTFTNNGNFNANANAILDLVFGSALFDNQSNLNINSSTILGDSGSGDFNNSGTITMSPASILTISVDAATDTGSWNLGSGGIELAGGTYDINAGFSNPLATAGLILINGSSVAFNVPVTLSSAITLNLISGGLDSSADMIVDGSFLWSDGGLSGTGLFTTNGVSTISGAATFFLAKNWTNNAAVFWVDGNLILDNATFTNNGLFSADATNALTQIGTSEFSNAPTGQFFVNTNTSISLSNFSQLGTLTLNGGDLTIPSLVSSGTLNGSGTIIGDVTNSGILSPGIGFESIGAITIQGNFDQTVGGTLEIELNGTVAGVDHDLLTVGGIGVSATLGGDLLLTQFGGYTPTANDNFQFITVGGSGPTFTGTFANEFLPPGFSPNVVNYAALSADITFPGIGTSAFTWIGGALGDWDIDGNWFGGVAPSAGDDAIIVAGSTVNINFIESANSISLDVTSVLVIGSGGLTIASDTTLNGLLIMSGGTLDITGATLTLNGGLNWTGVGTIFGGGTGNVVIPTLTNWTISGNVGGVDNRILDDVTVDNSGTIVMAVGLADNLVLNNNAMLNNEASGLFDFQSNTSVNGTGTFNNNSGSELRKSAGGGASVINAVFNNDDALTRISNGSLSLNGGGSFSNALTIADGELLLSAGTYLFNDASSINGATGNLGLTNATLSVLGTDTVTLNNTLIWKGASTISGPGNFNISSTGLLSIEGNLGGVNNRVLDNLTMNNFGTIEMAVGLADSINLINGTTLNNQSGGLFDFQSNVNVTGTGTFKNNAGGVLRKSVATGTSLITSIFENDAAEIRVSSGVLSLNGGGVFNNTLTIADGELLLAAGNYTFNDGVNINSLTGGSLGLTLATIDIPGTVTLNTLMTWKDATTISGPGIFVISSSGLLSLEGNVGGVDNRILDGLTLNNSGRIVMASGLADNLVLNGGSTLNNELGGVFDFQSNTAVTNTAGGGTFINNAGSEVIKSAGAGTSSINSVFNNNDALITISSGTFRLNGGGTFSNSLTISNGELLLNSNNYVFNNGASINSTAGGSLGLTLATIDIGPGTVTLNSLLSWRDATTISGSGTGTLSIGSLGVLSIEGNVGGVNNRFLDTLTLNNAGRVILATGLADNLVLNNGTTLNNNSGGVVDFQANTNITTTTPLDVGLFNNNAGSTLIKSAGTGTSTILTTFNQTGSTIDISSGTLSLNGTALTLDAGSVLQGSGTFLGDVNNNAGTVAPGGVNATATLTVTGNYSQGVNGNLIIEIGGSSASGIFDILNVTGSGPNTLAGNLTITEINGFNSVATDSYIFITTTAGFGGDFDGKFIYPIGYSKPASSGNDYQIDDLANNSIFFDNFNGNLEWNDANNWSAGFVPANGLDIDTTSVAGGVITISGGIFDINSLTTDSDINNTGGSLSVTGDVTVQDNFVYTQDDASAFTQFDGAVNNTAATGVVINNNQGEMVINGTVLADVNNDGLLSGSGAVTGNVTNGGTFNPGNSPGTFTVDGDLSLLASSILNIEIAGLLIGQEYDELIVTGNILFDGILNIIVDNSSGYTGALDDAFDPISFGSGSGTLALTASNGYAYDLIISSNKLNLITTSVPGLFIPEIQSDVVTLSNTTQSITDFENINDIEEGLENSDDEESSEALVCT